QCYDELNLSAPHKIMQIHKEYIDAGSEIIETNTYGANRLKLKQFGLEDRVREINLKGVEIAKKAAGDTIYIAGSMGKLSTTFDLKDEITDDKVREIYREQADTLIEGGVDLIIIETISTLSRMIHAIEVVREIADIPIVAQMTFSDEGLTHRGSTVIEVVKALDDLEVDVVGINCTTGPQPMLENIKIMAKNTHLPLSAQPNAGLPSRVEGRYIYLSTPEYMAEYAKRFIQSGVVIVGGCCGTTPAHIKAIKGAVKALQPSRKLFVEVELEEEAEVVIDPSHEVESSPFARKIGQKFVTCVEVDPPRGINIQRELDGARLLKDAGIDAVNIADGPRASARMSPIHLARILEEEVGIETIVHFCARDRNILGIQSDLIGSHILGLRNILLITGDPPKLGDYPNATSVFDVDSIGLVKIARNLNMGKDLAGNPIGNPTSFFIGVGANPGAIDLSEEIRRLYLKIKAGADFIMTQPVYKPELLEDFIKKIEDINIPIFVGILPLTSYRNAEFLHNEVPGMSIPDDIRERMRLAKSASEAREEGVSIAIEALTACKNLPKIAGAYIMPPFGRYDLAVKVAGAVM
ncbi:bifunctional homocysteine S-methyltransferase/methylenetetrahydrofolate reductase, partial [bacterium]|nr:bifunctional homocysteine S-methyltransferase/methylenetetrahydrofolate reductase [bacterium]